MMRAGSCRPASTPQVETIDRWDIARRISALEGMGKPSLARHLGVNARTLNRMMNGVGDALAPTRKPGPRFCRCGHDEHKGPCQVGADGPFPVCGCERVLRRTSGVRALSDDVYRLVLVRLAAVEAQVIEYQRQHPELASIVRPAGAGK